MGLLTDSHQSQNKRILRKYLIKFKPFICILLYVAGVVYFCSLAHSSRNNGTYFSENALLPGLVNSQMRNEFINYALRLHDDLERERETHKSTTPTAWILAKFRQIGLETYTHNFTLNYPLGGGRKFTGKNIYGILRAPRIGSTESIVISTPYRPPESIHPIVMPSLPMLIAFASFARKQKYWGKDIIFLVTDQEQLGMQAWLEAYHSSDTCNVNQVLNCGILEARAGSIQAAINLELQAFDLHFIDVKIEGLNGQLPNLDLVNLIRRLAIKEGLVSGHKQTTARERTGAKSSLKDNLKHMLSMVMTQATGVPNGNHGLFYRYGIEAVTLEGHKYEYSNHQRRSAGANAILRFVEGVARSLNNLLERFHQSFFFYLLVASDRFVSIGDFMPSLGLMVAALLIKAFITWLSINHSTSIIVDDNDDQSKESKNAEQISKEQLQQNNQFEFISVVKFLIAAHLFGVLAAYLPFAAPLDTVFHEYGIKTEIYLFYSLLVLSLVALTLPLLFSLSPTNVELLHIAALLETATSLVIVGMLNFSLGLLLSTFIVPFALFVAPNANRFKHRLSQLLCFVFNPVALIYFTVFALTWWSFGELALLPLAKRALSASMDALTFSIVDSIIYGNWLYPLVSLIFFPMWITFFSVLCITDRSSASTFQNTKLKMN